ncbi:MAG: DUF3052 domain-containing protein [Acidimicrobiales bacterium]
MAAASLAQKLGVQSDTVFALVHAESSFALDLPPSVSVRRSARGSASVVLAFFTGANHLDREIDHLGQMIFPAGSLWIAWPKRFSGRTSDLSDHAVRGAALPLGLVDNKVCAVDETWSALRLVWRRERR